MKRSISGQTSSYLACFALHIMVAEGKGNVDWYTSMMGMTLALQLRGTQTG
jgi:hypothetical protein